MWQQTKTGQCVYAHTANGAFIGGMYGARQVAFFWSCSRPATFLLRLCLVMAWRGCQCPELPVVSAKGEKKERKERNTAAERVIGSCQPPVAHTGGFGGVSYVSPEFLYGEFKGCCLCCCCCTVDFGAAFAWRRQRRGCRCSPGCIRPATSRARSCCKGNEQQQ